MKILSLEEGEDKVIDIVLEEEFTPPPTIDTKNDQTLSTTTVEHDQAPNIQENIQQELPIQTKELASIYEEQLQQP